MSEPPDEQDYNDVLRARGTEEARRMFDEAERKVIPFNVAEPSQGRRLRALEIARWDHIAVPEPDWTVHERIPRRQVALFSGEGAMGKSTLLLQLCAAHAAAKDWLGVMPEPGRAIFLDAEDDQDVIHRRLDAVRRHYGVQFADLDAGGLRVLSLAGEETVLAIANPRTGKVEATALYTELLAMAGDEKPVMIGLASAANLFAGNENDRSAVQQFVSLLARLAIVANGSVVLVSHPSLSGIASGSGMSGSTAWHNSVRARFVLHGVKKDHGRAGDGDDEDLREIEFVKNNYGRMGEKIVLQWRDGMFLPKPKPSPLVMAAQASRDDDVFTKILTRFIESGRTVSPYKSPTYAPAVFADEREARDAHVNGALLKLAMDRLMGCGRIRVEEFGPPSHRRSRVVFA